MAGSGLGQTVAPGTVITRGARQALFSFQSLRGDPQELLEIPNACFEPKRVDYYHRTAVFVREVKPWTGIRYQGWCPDLQPPR